MKLRDYKVYILRKSNDYDPIDIKTVGINRNDSTFTHRGHKYHFDKESSYIIEELWSPLHWLLPDRLQKYDRLMVFKEPDDPLHGVELPVEPLRVPSSPELYEESPDLLRGITRSELLRRYRAKQNFGKLRLPPWWVLVILGVLVVVAMLIMTGAIPLGHLLTGRG